MTGTTNNNAVDEDSLWIHKYVDSKDTQYLGHLYEKYKRKIFMLCVKMVKNTEEAKDLTSETFIKAFDHITEFRCGSPFPPWLSRIATNLCIDHLRHGSRVKFQQIYSYETEAHTIDPRPLGNQNHLRHRILQVLKQLKPPQRRCFCLFYIHRLSYQEVADLTGYSFDQVRSHIQNGRRKFKILMEDS
ncbi:MAG: sigma-70 family RNA polymerase sigma factor [Phycisphaerae bacterium]|nr:RNA polymerase sigma factor [candidate division KSB1 bacterium]NIV01024.1 sigma-70 family RNA polymerase sigma factor [Phycisphaerae bacterium]NIS25012.1 RNA polymerase sigma factor [candidate division KSB1 bacterium]NIT72821.1 RNA polymerase sigma factor [candidate division KSB1 bacterium]NIU25664.1 RNA polymerase sigma factor [candidate division KSB1 bacterium]